MESEDAQISELKILMHSALSELDDDIREISCHHLKAILKKKFGVRCSLRDIREIFCDGRYILSIGWGRGEDYIHRIPLDFKRVENIV